MRHNATGHGIAQKDIGIATECYNALLDTCATRVVESDHRCADLHREVLNLADLFCVHFSKGTTEGGKVLREDTDCSSMDCASSCNNAVS